MSLDFVSPTCNAESELLLTHCSQMCHTNYDARDATQGNTYVRENLNQYFFVLLKFFDGGGDGDGHVQRHPETWEAGNWFTKPFGLLSRKIRTQGDNDVAGGGPIAGLMLLNSKSVLSCKSTSGTVLFSSSELHLVSRGRQRDAAE